MTDRLGEPSAIAEEVLLGEPGRAAAVGSVPVGPSALTRSSAVLLGFVLIVIFMIIVGTLPMYRAP
jgi:hypothetical protein